MALRTSTAENCYDAVGSLAASRYAVAHMTRTINIQLSLALAFLCIACQRSTNGHNSTGIDTTIVRIADYTGDGFPDTSRLHLTARTFTSPFSWTFDVGSHERLMFHREGIDTWMDSLFADTGFVSGCSSYDDCKRKFYFGKLGFYVLKATDFDADEISAAMADSEHYGLLFYHDLVDSCGVNSVEAKTLTDSVALAVKEGRCLLVTFIQHPQSSSPILVYVERLRRFVPVYED